MADRAENLDHVAGLLTWAGLLVDEGNFDALVAVLAAANKRDLAIVRASRREHLAAAG